jgi:DNA invertase Pin-like site-specific DNA recombinase
MESAITRQGLRLDLVIRTSKRKAEAKSPRQQRDMAESCAQAHGYEIVHVHDSGTDESGKTMNRSSLLAARDRVRSGATDGVILALADRIGRAPIEEAMTTVRMFCTEGNLVLADMGGLPINLSDPAIETNLVVQLQMARQYWLMTASRFLRSQTDAIAAGRWIGKAPRGYEKTPSGERKGVLRPHPTDSGVITTAYELAAQRGLDAAVRYLAVAFPGGRWDADRARRLLGSRCYLGELHYGTFAPNLAAHPALTDATTWQAAQTDPHAKRASGDYPLTHKVHCGRCGSGLVGALQTVGERTYRRMRCSNVACRGGCSVGADKLEAHIAGILRECVGQRSWRDRIAPDGQALEAAQVELRAAQQNLAALPTVVAFSDPNFPAWKARAEAQVASAQQRHAKLAALAGEHSRIPGADEVDDPHGPGFAAALRGVLRFDRIVVAPGRGALSDRVGFDPVDDVAGPLAA